MADADERECRICRGDDEPDRPLFHPCRCSGSIKYTHEDCLVNWLAQSGSSRCELCNHSFRFEPLYQPNTPSALPTREFVLGVFALAKKAFRTFARIVLVFTVWLFCLPVGTCWTWYALFIDSPSSLPKWIFSRGPAGLVTDAFYGFLLSAGIVFIFLGVSSLREYIRHFPHDAAHPDDENHQQDEDIFLDDPHHQPQNADGYHRDDHLDDAGHGDPHAAGPLLNEENDVDFHHDIVGDADDPVTENVFLLEAGAAANMTQPNHIQAQDDLHEHHPHRLARQMLGERFAADIHPYVAHEDDILPDPDHPIELAHLRTGRNFLHTVHNQHDADDDHHLHDDEVLNEVDELVRDTIEDIAGADDSDRDSIGPDPVLAEDSDDNINPAFAPPGPDRTRRANHYPTDRAGGDEDDSAESDYVRQEHDGNFDGHDEELDMIGRQPPNGELDDDGVDVLNIEDLVDDDDVDARGEGGALFALFELDPDEVPLEEVVGLRGHLRQLFDNALTVLFSNAVFLGVFTLFPLVIGRITLRLFSMRSFPVGLSVLSREKGMPWTLWFSWLPTHILLSFRNSTGASLVNSTTVGSKSTLLQEGSKDFDPLDAIRSVSERVTDSHKLSVDTVLSTPSPLLSLVPSSHPPSVSYMDKLLIVLLGYGVIALLAVGYIGVMSMLRQRYPRLDSPVTRQIARMLRYVATFVKIVVLILFEFGIFPLGCGWWLDICTLDILGGTWQSRLSYCHDSPWICTGLHWIMGIVYMVQISLFISLLREVLRPELLWFLRNPDDPEFHPFRELVEKPLSRHARRLCISVIIYVPLVVALVYVPAQVCLKLLPNVFPFISEDFSHILIDVPFGNLLLGPLVHPLYLGRPELSLQKMVGTWVRWMSTLLGIKDLVVRKEDGERNGNPLNVALNGAVDMMGVDDGVGGAIDDMGDDGDDSLHDNGMEDGGVWISHSELNGRVPAERKRWVLLRGGMMIFAAWLTLILMESAMVSMPTLVGRRVMEVVGLPVRHDLHPFLLGLNILLGCVNLTMKVGKYMRTLGPFTILSMGMPYVMMAVRGTLMLLIGVGVIPLATGLLFELMLIPIRVGHNETPYFCMHQDWALGLLLLKVWACIAVTGGLGAVWRERVMRIREWDMARLDQHFGRTMHEVVIPIFVPVVTTLSVPYALARGFLPFVGVSRWVCNLVYRYAYLLAACGYCGWETTRYSVSMLRELHDSIRDDKYLVGKRLYNFSEPIDGLSTEKEVDSAANEATQRREHEA